MKALFFAIAGLTSCAAADNASLNSDISPGGADLDLASNQLRIDVYPGQDTPALEAQSFIANPSTDWADIAIEIKASVSVSGRVVGYAASPMNAEVPGAERMPVSARVSAVRLGTITGASVLTDSDGEFSLIVPPARGYQLSIVPIDDAALPFTVSTNTNISSALDLETIDLGYGMPVYGFVRTDDDLAIIGARVSLEHAASGLMGPSALTDSTGHYLLRAHPDDYILEVRGQIGRALPRIRLAAQVEASVGLRLDVNLGRLETSSIIGQVFDAAGGHAIRDVNVRLTAEQLAHSDGGLQIETETDGDGLFSRSILPGTWLAEFIPEFDSPLGAKQMTFTVGEERIDLGPLTLPDRIPFSSAVIDPDGLPVAGAAINAREIGFNGYIFSTTSDTDGRFDLDLPPHPVTLMVSPPTDDLAARRVIVDPANESGIVHLSYGEPVQGRLTSDGAAVRFALIEIRDMDDTLFATALTDNQGRFSVRVEGL